MAILTVGAGQTYATLAAAVGAAHNGDDIQVKPGNYVNDVPATINGLTIEGVGGMAKFLDTASPGNGKAEFVTGGNVTLRNVEVSGVAVGDGNGAAVRYQGGNLTLDHVYFHNNQEGILAADDPNGSIAIKSSEIAFNGNTYLQHNVYINNVGTTTVDNSYIHDVSGNGSEFRSRGANTTITNSRIVDGSNGYADNYTVDLPAGGVVRLQNDVFEKAAASTNPAMIHYSPDQQVPWHTPSSLTVSGSTFINDDGSSAYGISNQNGPGVSNGGPTAITAQLSNNTVYGLSSSHFVLGPSNQSGTSYVTSKPSISTAEPWDTTTPVNPPPPNTQPNAPGTYSLFGSGTPNTVTVNDPNAVELGVKFTSNAAGSITGIRFYKGPQNTGTHTGELWDASGTKLASATFSNETASGWQEADFSAPVQIAAGQTYTASYHTNAGMYAEDGGFFSSAKTSGPLTAPAAGNGVYAYGSGAFPSSTYNAANYWVDVVLKAQ